MDKKTFLLELQRSLRILKEEELQDIISEYEQHIDMKVARGLTEAEAIEDFGSLDELKAEILAAYHVRADYEVEQPGKTSQNSQEEEQADQEEMSGEKTDVKESDSLKEAEKPGRWMKGWQKITNLTAWIRAIFSKLKHGRHHEPVPESAVPEKTEAALSVNQSPKVHVEKKGHVSLPGRMIRRMLKALCHAVVCIWNWSIAIAWWCMKLCWNIWWIGCGLLLGCMGLVFLFGLGVVVVLWMQGYPLAGITVGCLGIVMGLLAAAGYAVTLICRIGGLKTQNARGEHYEGREVSQHA